MSFIERTGSPDNVYSNRRIDIIRNRWDERALHWDSELKETGCHLNLDDGYNRFLRFTLGGLSVLQQNHSPIIIDLACGTGLVTSEVVKLARLVIGVDISFGMIGQAQKKSIPHSTFIVADAFSLPVQDSSIDVVLSRGVLLSHYGRQHIEALLLEVARVVRPGGIFIVDYLHVGGMNLFPHKAAHKTYFKKEDIQIHASITGFTLQQIDGDEESRVHIIKLVRE